MAGHPTFFLDLAFPKQPCTCSSSGLKGMANFINKYVFSREYTCPGKLRFTVQMLQEWPFWQIGFKSDTYAEG